MKIKVERDYVLVGFWVTVIKKFRWLGLTVYRCLFILKIVGRFHKEHIHDKTEWFFFRSDITNMINSYLCNYITGLWLLMCAGSSTTAAVPCAPQRPEVVARLSLEFPIHQSIHPRSWKTSALAAVHCHYLLPDSLSFKILLIIYYQTFKPSKNSTVSVSSSQPKQGWPSYYWQVISNGKGSQRRRHIPVF